MYLGRTGGGAAQRLAHQLLEEAKAFQAAQPHGSIIPCIPLQGVSLGHGVAIALLLRGSFAGPLRLSLGV